MKTREQELDESMMGITNVMPKFKLFSVGRTRVLRELGNPMFAGEPANSDEWPLERKVGTAWVIFQMEMPEIRKLLAGENAIQQIDQRWEDEMHYSEVDPTYEWIMAEASKVTASRTEAVDVKEGKG